MSADVADDVVLRVRVLGVDVYGSTANGLPIGEKWGSMHPSRMPSVTFKVDDPMDLIGRLAAGEDLTVDVTPSRVLSWLRPPV